MKDNRLDELFRNELESHKITPPQNAWAKIEEGLPNKNKKGAYFWLSIAASIMLLATIGWLTFSNGNIAQQATQEVLSEVKTEVAPSTTAQSNDLKPKVDISTDAEKTIELIDPVPTESKTFALVAVANASKENADEVQESVIEDSQSLINENLRLAIDVIQPKDFKKPNFIVSNFSALKINLNTDILMQSVMLSPEEFEEIESERDRRPSFISGIVSVARGVNSGTKALSEIRKSKNEFITNDLKYGQKTDGSVEGTDEPPTKQ